MASKTIHEGLPSYKFKTEYMRELRKRKDLLKPLVIHCQKTRGAKSEVLRMMIEQGVQANWMQVSEWLHPKREKRRIPFGDRREALLHIMQSMTGSNTLTKN